MSQSVYCDKNKPVIQGQPQSHLKMPVIKAIKAIISQDISPNNPTVDGLSFREKHMYNFEVDFLLKNNLVPIQKLFNEFLTPKKRYITL